MPQIIEVKRDNFTISTDPSRLDMDAIVNMLTRAYWAKGRPRERTEHALGFVVAEHGFASCCSSRGDVLPQACRRLPDPGRRAPPHIGPTSGDGT
jgi:hypothetical protein